jgi:hypothetical protein
MPTIEHIIALVTAAVTAAQQLSNNRDIQTWAGRWIQNEDRSLAEAEKARNIMTQLMRRRERNDHLAVYYAALAAVELAKADDRGKFAAWKDAELAQEHAGQARYSLYPKRPGEPALVFDEWHYGSGWSYGKRARSYFPDET